jgi:hypothetical protein
VSFRSKAQYNDWSYVSQGQHRSCKYIESLCTPILFRNLDISQDSYQDDVFSAAQASERAKRISQLTKNVGVHLRFLIIQLQIPQKDDDNAKAYDEACCTIMKHAPYLRSLKVIYAHNDTTSHPLLHDALINAEELENVEFWEGDDTGPYTEVEMGTPSPRNDLLRVLLSHHSDSLRSLMFPGRMPLMNDLFYSLRDTTPKLHTLKFRRALSPELVPLFIEPVVWKCAPYLRHLKIYLCAVHAAHVATALLSGRFGLGLETVALWMNGENSDDQSLRPPSNLTWAGAQLEKLDLDHFSQFEMECFSLFPTRLLIATRIESAHFARMIRGGAFPGLQVLSVSEHWPASSEFKRDFLNLEEACEARGVTLRCSDISKIVPDKTTMNRPFERRCDCSFLEGLGPDYSEEGKGA